MKYLCVLGPGETMPGGMWEVSNQIVNYDMPMLKLKKIHIATAANRNKVWTFIKGIVKYVILCSSKKVVVAHINMSEGRSIDRTKVLIWISRFFHVKTIVHSHGSNFEESYNSMLQKNKEKFCAAMSWANRIIVLTEGWKNVWCQIVPAEKIKILPNGVNVGEDFAKKYFKNDRLNILFLGIIGHRKGTYDLIDSIEMLKQKKYKISVKVGGNGEIEKCRKYVQEKDLEDIVKIYGWVAGEEKKKLLEEADVLALPSYYESFGIVLLEAMANKIPVICGDGGYSKEVICDGVEGLVVESGNISSIANALEYFYFNPQIQEFGERGFRRVKEEYNVSKVMKYLQAIYLELLEKD